MFKRKLKMKRQDIAVFYFISTQGPNLKTKLKIVSLKLQNKNYIKNLDINHMVTKEHSETFLKRINLVNLVMKNL